MEGRRDVVATAIKRWAHLWVQSDPAPEASPYVARGRIVATADRSTTGSELLTLADMPEVAYNEDVA